MVYREHDAYSSVISVMARSIDPGELARISGAMLHAMAEARALNEAGDTGARFSACVNQAQEAYDQLLAHLIAAEPATAQYARGLADSMSNHLTELEHLLARASELQ